MLARSSNRSRDAPKHRRTSSAPTPAIEIEDLSFPLTNQEDLSPTPPKRSNTKATLGRYRKRNPDVKWRKKWNRNIDPFKGGRVLVVDCFSRDSSDDGRRKTQAQEFTNEKELTTFYDKAITEDKKYPPCLRIIHVQNAIWARSLLFKHYGIYGQPDFDGSGNAFSRWAQYDKPQRRAGHPVLNARAFRVNKSPWRRVWRTGFGVDYLRYFPPSHMASAEELNVEDFKLTQLNHWVDNEGASYPKHGYDVYVQRLSVYLQRNMEGLGLEEDEWEDYPDPEASAENVNPGEGRRRSTIVPPSSETTKAFDNTSTIIVFESSHSGMVRDTLLEARNEIERKWRRIFNDLPREHIGSDSELGLRCMDIAIGYILNGLANSWEKLLAKCDEHMSILEDRIYENPADESRAPELWGNSNIWLKVEKLLSLQLSAVNNFKEYLKEIAMDDRDFFHESPEQFNRVQTLIDEDLLKPTTNLNDLMYKSVGIRDSRHSLQLGTSMWRLSWITFVFLPLTFLSGFFGMNVTTFQSGPGYPNIFWYFVFAIPLMILVMISVNVLKSMVDMRREDPLRRSTYESIYSQFANTRPDLWSLVGPRTYVKPKGLFSRIKWRLIRSWFQPSKTIIAKPWSDINDMGMVARIKHWLARHWLKEIRIDPSTDPLSAAEMGQGVDGDFGAVFELIGVSTPVAMADGDPSAAVRAGEPLRKELLHRRSGSRTSRSSSGSSSRLPNFRSGSPASQGAMVEEEDDEDGDGSPPVDDDDAEWQRGRLEATARAERRKERKESPTAEGASSLLGVPDVNRQVLTSTTTDDSATKT